MSTPANSLDITQAGLVKFDGTSNFTGVTTTNHFALVGAASNGVTSVTPSTAGKVYTSNGVAADPSFETISNANLPGTGQITLTNGNNITVTGSPVALGGAASFNLTGTTNHALQVGNATASLTSLATGSAGQVLQSAGASADPAYSTATYPATATGTGKILRANGTNWVASTATYPDTAGTSGNVLTSDGTNWTSVTPPGYALSAISQGGGPVGPLTQTYFFGSSQSGTFTTVSGNSIYLIAPFTGTIKSVFGSFRQQSGDVTGTSTVNILVNGTPTVVSNSVTFSAGTLGYTAFSNNALSIAVTAGDRIEYTLVIGSLSNSITLLYSVTALIQ